MNMDKRKVSRMAGILVVFLLFLNFLLFLVLRDLNYGDYIPKIFFLRGLPLLVAGFLLSAFVWLFYSTEENTVPSLKTIMAFTLLLAAAVVLDKTYGEFLPYYFDDNRNCWELFTLGVTGFYVGQLVKVLDKEFTLENNLLSCLCIVVWTILGGVFTSNLSLAYAVSMAMTNSIIVTAAFFVVSPERKRYGNRLVYSLLYAGVNVVNVFMTSNAREWFMEFLYDESGWQKVQNNIFLLFDKAKMFGASYEGITKISKEVLAESGNSIHSIAYYFGLVPMIIYLLILVFMLIVFAVAVYKSKEDKSFFILTVAAFSNLAVRTVFGTFYSFGISPIRILPPFTGENGYFSDLCCAIVLWLAYNKWMKKAGYVGRFVVKESCVIDLLIKLFVLEDDEEWEIVDDERED